MFGFDVATLVALGLGGYIVGTWLYKKDEQIEDRRGDALKVAAVLREQGLTVAPIALEKYAVGDYSGLAKHLRDAAVVLTNPAAARAETDAIFNKMLGSRLANPAERAKLAAAIADATKAVKPAPAAE